MNYTTLVERTCTDNDSLAYVYNWTWDTKIELCKSWIRMTVKKGKTRTNINRRWRCVDRNCKSTISLFLNSIFEGQTFH